MENIKEILESDVFWHFVSVITSFIIVKITLEAERRNNKLNLKEQKRQHLTQLETEERLHKESLKNEREQMRANLLPFLKLEQDIRIRKRNDNYIFPLKLTNYGNSGAFDIHVKHKTTENMRLCYVYKYKIGDMEDFYLIMSYL